MSIENLAKKISQQEDSCDSCIWAAGEFCNMPYSDFYLEDYPEIDPCYQGVLQQLKGGIKRERDLLIRILGSEEQGCAYCIFAVDGCACYCEQCDEENPECEECLWCDNPCGWCKGNENWKWCGIDEAARRAGL